ncbi:MupA/Atu3671 family FMN-dependent luciferase-like monooxygenase [Streptomyces sp. NPDC057092]|uniref:MupA/Atu3671 family FMN-dependent luciferase-like monooxygenase n=1 Tax=Streptomyces sp. NPDC057092 TaxID=3346017 RepID=UPI00362CA1E7
MKFSLFFFSSGDAPEEQYRLLKEAARFADSHGFTAVWTPERHFHEFGAPFPNPSVTAAALATMTERVEIRAGSVVLPLHDPIRVAEEWAVVDQLSGGRTGLALASGWNPRDFVLAPDAFADNKSALRSKLAEVRSLWAGEEVERPGPDGGMVAIRSFPRPVQQDIPLWITAAGSPATFALAGELGHGVLTHLLGQTWEQLEDNLVDYGEALQKAGHGLDRERVAVMLHTYVADDGQRARDTARAPLTAYMRSSLNLFSLPAALSSGEVPEEELTEMLEHVYDGYTRSRCLIGSVQDCLPIVESLAQLGVDEIACLVDFGLPVDEVLRGLEALAGLSEVCADV